MVFGGVGLVEHFRRVRAAELWDGSAVSSARFFVSLIAPALRLHRARAEYHECLYVIEMRITIGYFFRAAKWLNQQPASYEFCRVVNRHRHRLS
jgi:hypothetical protein